MIDKKRNPREIHINPDIPLDPFQVECPLCKMFVVSSANPVIWIPGERDSKINERRLCHAVDLFHYHHRYMACSADNPYISFGKIPEWGSASRFIVGNRIISAYALIEKFRKYHTRVVTANEQ